MRFPRALNPLLFPKHLIQDAWITPFIIYSKQMVYQQRRDDPVFPAEEQEQLPYQEQLSYRNNATSPRLLFCVDNTEICNLHRGHCWTGADGYRAMKNPKEANGETRQEQLSGILLLAALQEASVHSAMAYREEPEAGSHCFYFECENFPMDQWKAEARRLFERSLARLQINLLNIVRGTPTYHKKFGERAELADYSDICAMGKFKSVGWRNVSVIGLFGLLFLPIGISLASIRSEDGQLWLIWWFKSLRLLVLWCVRNAKFVYSKFSERHRRIG